MGARRARRARPGDRAGRRRPGVGGVRRRQAARVRRGRHRGLRPPAARRHRATTRSSGCCASSTTDPRVSGILLQLPTPPQVDGAALTEIIDPAKDVDGLTPISAGLLAKGRPGLRPCTPQGVIELLRRYDVELEGAEAVVVGRSDLVGKPLAALLLGRQRHRHDLPLAHARPRRRCAGAPTCWSPPSASPSLVRGDWVKEGAVVIDVGINRTDDGLSRRRRLRAAERAAADHAGAGRRRADDDRDAAAQHAAGGARRGRVSRCGPRAAARRGVARAPPAPSRCSWRCSCPWTRGRAPTSAGSRRSA